MVLKKPSDFFGKETSGLLKNSEVSSNMTETYNKFIDNFEQRAQLRRRQIIRVTDQNRKPGSE